MIVSMVAADLIKWVAYGPVRLLEIHGWNNTGAVRYIQLHQVVPDTATPTLADGAVPTVKSLVADLNNGFMYNFGPGGITLTQLVVAISTNEASLAAPTAGTGLDMTLVVDTQYAVGSNIAIAGDLTTGVNQLVVWTDLASRLGYKLRRVDYNNNHGTDCWLLFSSDNGVTVAQGWFVPVGTSLTLYFGVHGITSYAVKQSDHTIHNGCLLFQSIGAPNAPSITSDNSANIKAVYTT